MIIAYFAEDGTRFDNRWDCEEYEYIQACKAADGIIIGRDADGELMLYSNPEFFDKAECITCKNDAAVQALQKRADIDHMNADKITQPGTYYWNEALNEWESADIKIENLKKELAKLERAKLDIN